MSWADFTIMPNLKSATWETWSMWVFCLLFFLYWGYLIVISCLTWYKTLEIYNQRYGILMLHACLMLANCSYLIYEIHFTHHYLPLYFILIFCVDLCSIWSLRILCE